jgi:hypothetical protein
MRTKSTATDELPDADIRCFRTCHIPYRLDFLRRAAALAAYPGVRDPALVEAALMAGQQLIQFLGFRLIFSRNGSPLLSDEKSEDYHPYEQDGVQYTDEVNTGRRLPESRSEPYQTVMFRKAAGHADLAFWVGEQESTMLMKPSTTHYLRRIKSGLSASGEWSSAMRLIGQAGRLSTHRGTTWIQAEGMARLSCRGRHSRRLDSAGSPRTAFRWRNLSASGG